MREVGTRGVVSEGMISEEDGTRGVVSEGCG